jgi:hypothetical protein
MAGSPSYMKGAPRFLPFPNTISRLLMFDMSLRRSIGRLQIP